MPATTIPITEQTFQGGMDLNSGLLEAEEEMSFVNDGYTVLFITNADDDTATDVTVTSVADNASRTSSLVQTVEINNSALIGPLRPLWWNEAGVVQVTFTEVTDVYVKAIKLQF